MGWQSGLVLERERGREREREGEREWSCVEGASLVLGGAVLDITAFKWIGGFDLSRRESKSCLRWGSFELNSLQMDWKSGLVS